MRGVEASKTVAVDRAAAADPQSPFFAALEAAFPVVFRPLQADGSGADAVIATGGDPVARAAGGPPGYGVPTLIVNEPDLRSPRGGRFNLADDDGVDRRLRGFSGPDPLSGPPPAVGSAEAVLATADGGPAWTLSAGAMPVHRLRSSLPTLEPTETLRDLLRRQALALVAIVHLLRALGGEGRREPPPIRASFLFDDPNLHRPTYGFLDYEQLVAHADRHGYHASMAMIPLDGRFPHRDTVELFRRRPDRLSLVMHGNNHRSRELMRPTSSEEALGLAAQALRRTAGFERRTGIRVGRVMVPPHGMCSAAVAGALGVLGYDALCAIHPYPWREQPPATAPLAGWEPAEFAAGCAVIPRVHLETDFEEMAIRAFLDQPLIVYGHHNDLADGLDRLEELSGRLARLGEVRWTSLDQIAAGNFATARAAGSVALRPFSQRMSIELGAEVEALTVLAPRGSDGAFAGWSTTDRGQLPFGAEVPVGAGRITLRLDPANAIDPADVQPPRPTVWPLVRRIATETRDRLEPLLARPA